MPGRIVPVVAGAALIGVLGLAAPALAGTSPEQVDSYVMTSGRVWSLAGAGLGLAGTVLGGLALAGTRVGRKGAVAALGAGLVGGVIGALVVAVAEGGPGTGYGIVGGYIAVVVSLMATVLGGLGLARTR